MMSRHRNKRIPRAAVWLLILILAAVMTVPTTLAEDAAAASEVRVGSEGELRAAIGSADGTAAAPSVIHLTESITLSSCLEFPAGKYIQLEADSSDTALRISGSFPEAQSSGTAAMVSAAGGLTVKNLTIDASRLMRTMRIDGGAEVKLSDGAVIRGGAIGGRSNMNGSGIMMKGSNANPASLTIESGAAIRDNICRGSGQVTYACSGLGLYLGTGSRVTMNGGTISGNVDKTTANLRKAADGGGVAIYSGTASFTMNGGMIENNLARREGGGVCVEAGTFTLNGGEIRGNSSQTIGGGVYTLGKLQINGGAIRGNTVKTQSTSADSFDGSYALGGGIYVDAESSNQSGDLSDCGRVEMKGGEISSNSVSSSWTANTHRLDVGQGGGVYNDGGQFIISAGSITANKALAPELKDDEKSGNGGGIATAGGHYPGETVICGGTISNNQADGYGDDLYLNADKHSVSGTSPYTETVYDDPGVLRLQGSLTIGQCYLPAGAELTVTGALTGSQITLDTAETSEGTKVAEAENTTILAADARTLKNSEGKKIYRTDGEKITIGREQTSALRSLTDAEVDAIDDAIYCGSPVTPQPTVTLDGTTLTRGKDYLLTYRDNTAAGTATVVISGNGDYDGSIEQTFRIQPRSVSDLSAASLRDRIRTGNPVTPAVTLTMGETVLTEGTDYTLTYADNTEVGTAAVTVTGRGNFTGSRNLTFEIVSEKGKTVCSDVKDLNKAIADSTGTAANPAAIWLRGSEGSNALTNTERRAVLVPEGKYVQLIGAEDEVRLTGSYATAGSGTEAASSDGADAAMCVRGSVTLTGLTLDADRKSTGSKGRVLTVEEGGRAVIDSDTVLTDGNCTLGGAVHNEGTLELNGGTIRDNRGTGQLNVLGGAVYNAGTGTMTMNGGRIADNTAVRGGGIYNGGSLTVSGGTITGNSVSGNENNNSGVGAGGGIYNAADRTAAISGAAVTKNSASDYGGGIYNGGTLSLTNTAVDQNSSSRTGGGVWSGGRMTMSGGSISGNTILNHVVRRVNAAGGGVCLQAGTFTMESGSISGNSAVSKYQDSSAVSSLGNGGGIYVANSRSNRCIFTMNGGTISGNAARSYQNVGNVRGGHGGGVFVLGGDDSSNNIAPGTFRFNGGTITGNRANHGGSGVFCSNCELSNTSGAFIDNNHYNFIGNAVMAAAGSGTIGGNDGDNVCLEDGVTLTIAGALSGSIGITVPAEKTAAEDLAAAEGTTAYRITAADAAALKNDLGRSVTADTANNRILLTAPYDLADGSWQVQLDADSYPYTGSPVRPTVKVCGSADPAAVLEEGVDYRVSFPDDAVDANGDDPAYYRVTVTGLDCYRGTLTKDYTITPISIEQADVSLPDQCYTGKAIRYQPIEGTILFHGRILREGDDYEIEKNSYRNNTGLGTASFTIRGIGNFNGTRTVNFRIVKNIAAMKFGKIAEQVYSGRAKTPAVTVRDGSRTLRRGTDYTLSYAGNVVPGLARITVTGCGSYGGSRVVTFRIVPAKGKLLRVRSGKKGQLQVIWKKDKYASGYQISAAANRKFSKNRRTMTVGKYYTKGRTLKKLKRKKYYYVRVRSYKTISGKKYYGPYSTVKKCRVR